MWDTKNLEIFWSETEPTDSMSLTSTTLHKQKNPFKADTGQQWWADFVWTDRIMYESLSGSGSGTLERGTPDQVKGLSLDQHNEWQMFVW
jgi:hypothetical protein